MKSSGDYSGCSNQRRLRRADANYPSVCRVRSAIEANYENKNNSNYWNVPALCARLCVRKKKPRFDSGIFQTSLMRRV